MEVYCNSIGDIICNRGLILYNGTIDDIIYNKVTAAGWYCNVLDLEALYYYW